MIFKNINVLILKNSKRMNLNTDYDF